VATRINKKALTNVELHNKVNDLLKS